ncbi:aquaporin-like protein [Myriangium duriaei CBS 260.36]|uniref:Aquaporin-like protein n=1 Tax=Myriangium duriaei CBS 260.36 TaxID=1168546 RepID=A0A9P4J0G0_9PEZI|nr:aquaporin-like protein [Myriangium duriaei CBS 260.36]
MSHADHISRLRTHDMEIGATEAAQRHFQRHVVAVKPVSQRKLDFEKSRPRWLREVLAEGTGVFFYVYPGIASVASTFLNQIDVQNSSGLPTTFNPGFGSLLQIGLAFALGIAFAIIVCAPTSGGHFNPAITICFATWQGFPWRKVPYYIFAQIIGAMCAGLLVYGQYHQQLEAYAKLTTAAGLGTVFNGGPASIFCSFPSGAPAFKLQQSNGYLFLIEFFVDSYIGLVIWAALDPANPFITPSSAPFVIGLAYAAMVWGFANITISTNLARDLGTRIVAAIFYGREAFSYMNYSPIAIFVNIPATLFATGYYELVLRDSLQKLAKGAAVHEGGEEGLALHLTKSGIPMDRDGLPYMEKGATNATGYSNGENGYETGVGTTKRNHV